MAALRRWLAALSGTPRSLRGYVNATLVAMTVLLGNCSCPEDCPTYCAVLPDSGTSRDGALSDTPDTSRTDSGRADAGPADPTWALLPGLPDGCLLERAEHPERLPALSWAPCGDGCQRADLGTLWMPLDGYFRDGRAWLALVDGTAAYRWDAIVPADGPPIAAWRSPERPAGEPVCGVFFLAVNEGAAGVVVTFVAHDAASTVQDRIYMAPFEALSLVEEPVAIFEAPRVTVGRHAQEIAVSSDLAVIRIGGGDIVVAQSTGTVDAFTASVVSGGYHPAAERDHVVFAEVEAAWRLMHWTPETGTEAYYDPPDDIGDPLLDGGTLVWIRYADFVGGLATRAELWTAPFVRNPAELAPRMVHPRVEPNYAHLGGGVYGWMGAPEVHLVDIDSGRERLLMPPPGTDCADLLYVSSTDVAINCVELATSAQVIYRLDPRVVATDAPPPGP